jgi:cytoskeletal protein RodZ
MSQPKPENLKAALDALIDLLNKNPDILQGLNVEPNEVPVSEEPQEGTKEPETGRTTPQGNPIVTTDTSTVDKAANLFDQAASAVVQWFQQAALEDEMRKNEQSTRTVASAAAKTTVQVKTQAARAAYADIAEVLGPLADEIIRMTYEYIQVRDAALTKYLQGEISGTEFGRVHDWMMDLLRYIATYKLKIPPVEITGGGE